MLKILGSVLVLDAVLSLIVVKDKRPLWQIGRSLRLIIGIYLTVLGWGNEKLYKVVSPKTITPNG